MKKYILIVLFVLIILFFIIVFINKDKEENYMDKTDLKINLNINGTFYSAIIFENETSKEFIEKLPLNIEMKELNGNEKYYYFDKGITSNPSNVNKIYSGDIMLYGDNCLVLFYETFNISYSYTKIGKIENPASLKSIVGSGNIKVVITKQ